MKVAFLLTGIPRQFSKNLKLYLDSLEKYLNFDIYLYFPKENCEENYANEMFDPKTFLDILNNPRYKLLLLDTILPELSEDLSRKQKNSIIQWYRIYRCFSFINDDYDIIIRIRPDIKILIDPSEFCSCLEKVDLEKIHIPFGFETSSNSYNDHFAFGSYKTMNTYCSLYTHLTKTHDYASDTFLYSYLNVNKVSVQQFSLPYKLALSECKVIAIAGDSASGKTTLMNYIQEILPDNTFLSIETDSYHKWERSSENWKTITHLNPEANNLERLSEDVLRLKIGSNTSLIEYDHGTGRFTPEKITSSKPFLIVCGLHTLYMKNLLKNLDLKIFINTQESLCHQWKIQRDMKERNYTIDKIMDTILKRKEDSEKYILPQKEHANFIINYYIQDDQLKLDIVVSNDLSVILQPFSDFFSEKCLFQDNHTSYTLRSGYTGEQIKQKLLTFSYSLSFLPQKSFQDGTTGILQMILFLLLFYEYE
jgi:uridine kinase